MLILPPKWTKTIPTAHAPPPEDAYTAQFALITRSKLSDDPGRDVELHSMIVQSTALKESLGRALADYPGVTTSLSRLEFAAPFAPFVHRWEALRAEQEALCERMGNGEGDTAPKEVAHEHLCILMDVLESELGGVMQEKKDLERYGVVRFEMLWMVFQPGGLVYRVVEGRERVYKVRSAAVHCVAGVKSFKLECAFVDFDGSNFGYVCWWFPW